MPDPWITGIAWYWNAGAGMLSFVMLGNEMYTLLFISNDLHC